MRAAFAIAFALGLTLLSAPLRVSADELGTDPTRAGMCEDFDGLSFVFCVAMCEARECDRLPPSDERCAALAEGFASVSRGAVAPCASGAARGSI